LKLKEEPHPKLIIEQLERYMPMRKWEEVVFCGFGEPTMRLDCILEVTRWIKRYHPDMRVRLDTNGHGYLLNPERKVVEEIREAGVDAVTVSLNGHDEETYQHVCKPSFKDAYKRVLFFIAEAKRANLEIEVTAVRIPEIDISRIQNLALQLGVNFRARDYIPCFY